MGQDEDKENAFIFTATWLYYLSTRALIALTLIKRIKYFNFYEPLISILKIVNNGYDFMCM